MGAVARVPLGAFGDLGEPVLVMVAPVQEGRAGGRAERSGVPLAVHQAVVSQLLEGRHLDPAAEG